MSKTIINVVLIFLLGFFFTNGELIVEFFFFFDTSKCYYIFNITKWLQIAITSWIINPLVEYSAIIIIVYVLCERLQSNFLQYMNL